MDKRARKALKEALKVAIAIIIIICRNCSCDLLRRMGDVYSSNFIGVCCV